METSNIFMLLFKQPQGKPELGLQAIILQHVTIFIKWFFTKQHKNINHHKQHSIIKVNLAKLNYGQPKPS